jgi:hypothetical protein
MFSFYNVPSKNQKLVELYIVPSKSVKLVELYIPNAVWKVPAKSANRVELYHPTNEHQPAATRCTKTLASL